MLSWILNVLKSAIRLALRIALLPVTFLLDLVGWPVPPPPPPLPPEDEVPNLPDPARQWAREIHRWARRRTQGRTYQPDVPGDVATWLATLDDDRIVRLASLKVSAIYDLLNSRTSSKSGQSDPSNSSRSASASASSRSARRARDFQYSAAERQSHSR
jgi:hypothetical protein